jgi:Rrf2 family protein
LLSIFKGPYQVHTATSLSRKLKIPKPFLRRIMQRLAANGIVTSTKGKGGGFASSKSADKLTLIEVMGVFQGDFSVIDCVFKKHICSNRGKCLLRKSVKNIEKDVHKRLAGITLRKLMK